MKKYPLEKYMFTVDEENHEVIAMSSYAGRPVRGIAKCDPRDTFSEEYGKRLAAAKCNEAVALERYKNAKRKLKMLNREAEILFEEIKRCNAYYTDASASLISAKDSVKHITQESC